jgi:hypothetical protein
LHSATSPSLGATGLEDLPELGNLSALEAELGGPSMSAYAIRTEHRGGVREVKPSARRVMHVAVYEEAENGVGAWLKALQAEARALLLQLEHTSWTDAMDELKGSNRPRAHDDSDDDGLNENDAREDELDDVRAVERWLVVNGALRSDAEAAARASRADEPMLLLSDQLRPPTREFARAHFDLTSRARRTLDSLGHELGDLGKQSEFAATIEHMRFNRLLARSQVVEPASSARDSATSGIDGVRKARRPPPASSALRDDSWDESIRRVSHYVRLTREGTARHAKPADDGHGAPRKAAGLSAREREALRRALSKHRELIRRVFYSYRALDGLQPDLPGGGRLPVELGGPTTAELDGLPPLQMLRTAAESEHVASDGRRAQRAGEPTDPTSARISLAQLWRLLKDTRMLGGGLTTAKIDELLAEAGTLDNARAAEPLGYALPPAHDPLASATLCGFAESLVVVAHARYAQSTPSIGRAFERLCCDQLDEYACQGAGCVAGLRATLYDSAPLRCLFGARAEQLRRLYFYWASVHYSVGDSRKRALRAGQPDAVARALHPRAGGAQHLGDTERTADRSARADVARERRGADATNAVSDASTLRALGATLPDVVDHDAHEDLGALIWCARGGALNLNHILVMLAEAQLLARARRAGEAVVTAAEVVRLFEATAAVSGAQPRACAANLVHELTHGEFLEFVARLADQLGRLAARPDARSGPPLEALVERLLADSLVPHTERLLNDVELDREPGAPSGHAVRPAPAADGARRAPNSAGGNKLDAVFASHTAVSRTASASGVRRNSVSGSLGARRGSGMSETASSLRDKLSSGH